MFRCFPKKFLIEICDIVFDIFLTYDGSFFLLKLKNPFSSVFPISNEMEIFCIITPFLNVFYFGPLRPFKILVSP